MVNISARISFAILPDTDPFGDQAQQFRQVRGGNRRLRDLTIRLVEQMEQFAQHPIGGKFRFAADPFATSSK